MIKTNKKKSLVKTVSLIVAIVVLSVCVCGLNTFATDVNYNLTTVNIDPNKFTSSKTNFDESLCNYIAQEMSDHEEYIYITDYDISTLEISDLFTTVVYENPQLFFVNPTSIRYSASGNKVLALVPTYIYNVQETAEKSAILEENIEKLISGIDINWKDELKALTIHDNLIINCEYALDEVADNESENIDIYTAYGALVDKKAVCQGYTLAYNYMLSKFGINSHFISSYDMNHAWSMVQIDGKYYHVDVTWDDPTYDKLGQAYHTYFLKSDKKMLNDTTQNKHYNWDSEYKAESTLYDGYFWNDIKTIIPYINGNFYYISNQSEDIGNIIKYDGNHKTSILKMTDRWYVNSSHTSFWNNNFSYLATDKERLYYNTPENIYSVKLDGTDQKLEYTINTEQAAKGYIYGLKLDSDGYLYISVVDNPNRKVTNYKTVKISDDHNVPVTSEPVTSEPVTSEPVTSEPVTSEPVTSEPVTSEPPVTDKILLGDVDLDKHINVKDATLIQLYVAGLGTLNEKQLLSSNVDNSDGVNVKDATFIQLYCAKLGAQGSLVGTYIDNT